MFLCDFILFHLITCSILPFLRISDGIRKLDDLSPYFHLKRLRRKTSPEPHSIYSSNNPIFCFTTWAILST